MIIVEALALAQEHGHAMGTWERLPYAYIWRCQHPGCTALIRERDGIVRAPRCGQQCPAPMGLRGCNPVVPR